MVFIVTSPIHQISMAFLSVQTGFPFEHQPLVSLSFRIEIPHHCRSLRTFIAGVGRIQKTGIGMSYPG